MPSRNLDAFQRVGFRLFRVARSRHWRLGEKNCDGTNRPAPQALYDNTAARAGVAYSGTYCATAAHQVARGNAQLLFGKVKIWGEIVEHEAGYRSQFGKIVSLDHGDPELLMKFRAIYRLNMSSFESSRIGETFQ